MPDAMNFLQGQRLENFKIVSQVRTYLSERLDIRETQKILSRYWKPFMEQPNIMLTDATCYESSVRYPTNVKLLWESVDWCYGQLQTDVQISEDTNAPKQVSQAKKRSGLQQQPINVRNQEYKAEGFPSFVLAAGCPHLC